MQWLTRNARLEDEATHEYFVRWTESVDEFLHQLTAAGKRVIVLVPAPAMMIVEEAHVLACSADDRPGLRTEVHDRVTGLQVPPAGLRVPVRGSG